MILLKRQGDGKHWFQFLQLEPKGSDLQGMNLNGRIPVYRHCKHFIVIIIDVTCIAGLMVSSNFDKV